MTAQINDRFVLDDDECAIVGVNGRTLFTPKSYGLTPVAISSACWRGYICQYRIQATRLVLSQLQIAIGRFEGQGGAREFHAQSGPPINGIEPVTPESEHIPFNCVYAGLDLPIDFSGGLLVADHFIPELYVHMGFHPAWKYRMVCELLFEHGLVSEMRDVSQRIEEIRRRMAGQPLKPNATANEQDIEAWVESTFRLSYSV